MELLKQLKEAQASGLSKEEYFHLLDMELKLTANKKQVPDLPVNINGDFGEKAIDHDAFFQNVCTKLMSQQLEENRKLQQQMRDLFEQQKNQLENQIKNLQQQLQQQQELQQRQLQQIQLHLQQQLEKEQVQQELQKEFQQKLNELSQQNELYKQFSHESVDGAKTRDVHSEQTVQQMKDEFHEMRSTVLNRLEEEKTFLRDALSEAQKDILSLLSTARKDVKRVEEMLEANALVRLEKQIGHVLALCEDILLRLIKQHEAHNRDVKMKENQARGGKHSMVDPYNSDCFDSPF